MFLSLFVSYDLEMKRVFRRAIGFGSKQQNSPDTHKVVMIMDELAHSPGFSGDKSCDHGSSHQVFLLSPQSAHQFSNPRDFHPVNIFGR